VEYLAILFGISTGICFLIIQIRWHLIKGLPLFGALLSPKIFEDIDRTDKLLALLGMVFFILTFFCIVSAY
jgi:hypothetical protein